MDPVDIDVSGTTVRATDLSDSVVEIDTVGWDTPAPTVDFEPIPRNIQASVSGRAAELTFPAIHATVYAIAEDDSIDHLFDVVTELGTLDLPEGRYYLNLQSRPNAMVRFDGAAALRRRSDQRLVLSFEHSTAVTLAFNVGASHPQHTITVEATSEGLATALSHLSTPLSERGVANVSLARQGHPPLVEVGEETIVPEAVVESTPDTGIELDVPEGPEWLFPAAPLAYYLGATVDVGERDRPVLRAPAEGIDHEFEPLPDFQLQAATLARRTFQLDLLLQTRCNDIVLAEWDDLPEDMLDVDRLEDATNAERLRTYLDLPEATLEAVLPDWNARWYVEPTIENASVVPFALADMALLLRPDVAPQFGDAPGASDDRDDPDDFEPFVGWFADDPPSHAFRARRRAFANELDFARFRDADVRRVVVVNDPDRAAAGDATVDSFRERPPEPLPVEVRRDVPCDELADLLATPTDVLHFVGPSEEGFDCPDGTLDPEAVEDVGARLLFLDGPDSTDVGETAIERGSVAAVVRRSDRAPSLSADVRRLFLDLVAAGFRLNSARLAAERYAEGHADLGILGSGLARISENSPGNYGHLHGVDPVGDGRFVVEDYAFIKRTGYYWRPDFPDAPPALKGGIVRNTTDTAGVKALVRHTGDPIVYGKRVFWPDAEGLFYPLA